MAQDYQITDRRRRTGAATPALPSGPSEGDFLPLVALLFGQLQDAAGHRRTATPEPSDIVGFVTGPPRAPSR
jgi:hypothetical protein